MKFKVATQDLYMWGCLVSTSY